ncbi:AGAP006954-PA [Anopheles gambiae str. PEST]|uniref:Phenoloxidase-activating factor 2 n=1 Tax=Anopheles gambiae TaxID=7165 RepID=Q7QIM7_ANOGA|nr:AGAP006954-PA [Anopheles gambiae str. PEST]
MRLLGSAALLLVLSAVAVIGADEWGWLPLEDGLQGEEKVREKRQDIGVLPASQQNVTEVSDEDILKFILDSGRQGRSLEGFDEVYSDPSVQDALQNADDAQARNIIKDKLCSLGLMQCDGQGESIEGKRPYYPIYAQQQPPRPRPPVRGPPLPPQQYAQRPPQPPQQQAYPPKPQHQGPYGPPKPMPVPNHAQHKIGYAGPQQRPPYSGPPNSFAGPSYASAYPSKPLGPIYEGDTPPFEFEPIGAGEKIYEGPLSKPGLVLNEGPLVKPVEQHIHHHYHHIDGAADSKTVVVNNPGPVGASVLSGSAVVGGSSSSIFNSGLYSAGGVYGGAQGLSGGGFSPLAGSDFDYKELKGVNNNNGFGQSGVYAAQSKPVNSLYSGESSSAYQGGNGAGFHSSNPALYKKELNVKGPAASNGLGTQFANGNGIEDCVCVPYDQCPAQDVIGRKDDLILPLDPRNLKTDIEAAADEVVITDGNGTMTVVRVPKNATAEPETKTKKISKREAAEGKSNEAKDKASIEPRLLGGGNGGDKKVVPTFGVSFGLPYPTGGYPLNPYGPHPAPNPYFGSLSANGLNLGLINVNPLLSLQVTKDEYGDKVLKPLVNLHVTPTENIVHKIGGLLAAKKQNIYHVFNQHEHYHSHHGGYPRPPPIYHPHHVHGPPPPPPYFRDASSVVKNGEDTEYYDNVELGRSTNVTFAGESTNAYRPAGNFKYQSVYPQNAPNNINANRAQYGRQYQNYRHEISELPADRSNAVRLPSSIPTQSVPTPAPGHAQGSPTISFPSSRRRRRATDVSVPESLEEGQETVKQVEEPVAVESSSVQEKSFSTEKRQAYYGPRPGQQQQQCSGRQVCCRKPVYRNPASQNLGKCGVRNAQGINGRIKNPVYVDGDSEFGEYPWQVAILKKDPKESVYVCGGTLIDNLYIITAAHCVKTYNGFDLRVRLGEWDVNHDVEFYPYIERDIISVQVHPEYYAGTLDNDLAILKMDRPVDLTSAPHIAPACLPDKHTDFSGQRCWTTGWGKDAFGDYGKYQNILKEVDVPIVNHYQCQNQLRQTRLGYTYNLNQGFICAGGEEGKDACKGDGGGPLVCERNGVWQVVGVVSWGIGCGQANVPGVYVKVAHYLDWINQVRGRF